MPQIASIGLVGGFRDGGAIGVEETTDGPSAADAATKMDYDRYVDSWIHGLLE